jgi:hypothetical protein
MEPKMNITKKGRSVLLILLLAACLVSPALAGTRYLDGTPNLTAYMGGTNQYTAGSDIQIPVVIKNTGISTNYEVSPDIVNRTDVPTTAKFVTVAMGAGTAPIVIKSDPQMIGDIASQGQQTAIFSATVNTDAAGGTYTLPLNISYTQFDHVDQYGMDTFRNYYVPVNVTLIIPLVIKSEVIPEVISATSDQLVAGSDGYLNLTIANTGSLDGTKATVKIEQDNNSPISPVDSSVYIGVFPAGSTVSCQYKVAVDKAAENKTYPINVVIIYQNDEGDFIPSQTETVGVDVGNKVNFTIRSFPIEVSPGSKHMIQVEYQNTGNSTVYGAQARISIVDPFTSSSDVAYLGDISPGQTAVAAYQISVASDATLKQYGLDSEIRYTNAIGDTYVSDPMKVPIEVQNLTGIQGIISSPAYISLIVAVTVGIIYAVMLVRKRQK